MITSILAAVKKRESKFGATLVTAETEVPLGIYGNAWFDGAVKGNPGMRSVGYHINDLGSPIPLVYAGGMVGHGTNNEAEYLAFILMMRHALRLGIWDMNAHTDSELLYRQISGRYMVKSRRLKQLWAEAKTLMGLFRSIQLHHVPREKNVMADELSHRVVYVEPILPRLGTSRGQTKTLHDFQAAAIRSWHLRKLASTNVMERIFRVSANVIDQVAAGKTYKNATFDLPPLVSSEQAEAPTLHGVAISHYNNDLGAGVAD